jgi:hypothetical protein
MREDMKYSKKININSMWTYTASFVLRPFKAHTAQLRSMGKRRSTCAVYCGASKVGLAAIAQYYIAVDAEALKLKLNEVAVAAMLLLPAAYPRRAQSA